MSKILAGVLVLGLVGAAQAAVSSLEVKANRPASVFIDGQPRGRAPLTVTGIPPGVHTVKIVDETTGYASFKPFFAPSDRALAQTVNMEFQGGRVLTAAERAAQEAAAPPPPPAPVVLAPPPPAPVYTTPYYPYGGTLYASRSSRRSHRSHHSHSSSSTMDPFVRRWVKMNRNFGRSFNGSFGGRR